MRRILETSLRALPLWMLFGAAGCGAHVELAQVDGTLTFQGVPLANVLVTFIPEASGEAARVRSLAVTDDEGRFRLQTDESQEGAVVGRHRVIVEDLAIYSAPRTADGTLLTRPPARFPPAYADPLTSPLTVDVQPGAQSIALDLSPTP